MKKNVRQDQSQYMKIMCYGSKVQRRVIPYKQVFSLLIKRRHRGASLKTGAENISLRI